MLELQNANWPTVVLAVTVMFGVPTAPMPLVPGNPVAGKPVASRFVNTAKQFRSAAAPVLQLATVDHWLSDPAPSQRLVVTAAFSAAGRSSPNATAKRRAKARCGIDGIV